MRLGGWLRPNQLGDKLNVDTSSFEPAFVLPTSHLHMKCLIGPPHSLINDYRIIDMQQKRKISKPGPSIVDNPALPPFHVLHHSSDPSSVALIAVVVPCLVRVAALVLLFLQLFLKPFLYDSHAFPWLFRSSFPSSDWSVFAFQCMWFWTVNQTALLKWEPPCTSLGPLILMLVVSWCRLFEPYPRVVYRCGFARCWAWNILSVE